VGHHYIPQRYLRQFEQSPGAGRVFQHLVGEWRGRSVAIVNAAQSKGFYTEEQERMLGTDIETPGSEAMEALLAGNRIDLEQRCAIGAYLATMQQRVPQSRRKSREQIPNLVRGWMQERRKEIAELAATEEIDPARVAEVLAAMRRVEEEAVTRQTGPIEAFVRDPRPFPLVTHAITCMWWRIFATNGPQFFVTTDNPLVDANGFGNTDSEFFFPLSPRRLLHGSWLMTGRQIPICRISQAGVRYINRVLILSATTAVYANMKCPWMTKFANITSHTPHVPYIELQPNLR